MSKTTHHVIPNPNGGWAVKRGGASRASRSFDNQSDAITYARDIARNARGELFIHGKDGTIKGRDSFVGNDPFPPRAKK